MTNHLYLESMTSIGEPQLSDGDKQKRNSYLREFFPGMVLYVVAVLATSFLVGDDPSMGRRMLLLIPVLPCLWSLRAVVRMLGRADERERLVHLEGMSVGFGVMIVVAITLGFVGLPGNVGVLAELSPWLIFGAGMAAWGITSGVRAGQCL